MRLTKRQLKRIIREEYSRLKRRGLIKETGRRATYGGSGIKKRFVPRQDIINEMIMFLDDLMASERGMELEYDQEGVIAELQSAFPDATMEEVMEAMESF